MTLTIEELYSISESLAQMSFEDWNQLMILLNRTQELNSFLALINREDLNPCLQKTRFDNHGKVLIIGSTKLKNDKIESICEEYGIHKNRIEIVNEYTKNYDFKKTRYNHNYAAILVGPMPHKARGTGNHSSAIQTIMTEDGYPPVVRMVNTNNKLHISAESLRKALETIVSNKSIVNG